MSSLGWETWKYCELMPLIGVDVCFFFLRKRKERKPHEHIGCPILGSAGVFHSLQRQDRHDENISGG